MNQESRAEATRKQVADLIARAERGEEVYEQAVAVGLEESASQSEAAFNIGDLAERIVAKKYGEDEIGKFAKQIRRGVDRVKEYRTTVRAFDKSVRDAFRENNPTLTYSDYRAALPVYRKLGLEEALDFLEAAAADGWTCERIRLEARKKCGKPALPPKRTWTVDRPDSAQATEDGRLSVWLKSLDGQNIRDFVQKHWRDADFQWQFVVTYNQHEGESDAVQTRTDHQNSDERKDSDATADASR